MDPPHRRRAQSTLVTDASVRQQLRVEEVDLGGTDLVEGHRSEPSHDLVTDVVLVSAVGRVPDSRADGWEPPLGQKLGDRTVRIHPAKLGERGPAPCGVGHALNGNRPCGPVDPAVSATGRITKRWNLRVNVDLSDGNAS